MSEAMFKVLKASINILNEDVRAAGRREREAAEALLYCDFCEGPCKDRAYHKVVRESYEHAMKHKRNGCRNRYKRLE